MADCSEWKVRTAVEEEGSKAETEAEEEKGGVGGGGNGRSLEELVLEVRRCVFLVEGPRRRPGRAGFPKALCGALKLNAWRLSCRCGGVGMMGVRKF